MGYIALDDYGRECLYKMFQVGSRGLLEIGLSWQGLAGPLVEEWQKQIRKHTEAAIEDARQPTLFADLDEEKQKRVDQMMNQVRIWEDGRRIMEVILGQVGKQGRNPIEIPAEAFRVLLWPDAASSNQWPKNWKSRIEGALTGLHALTFRYRTYQMESMKGYGSFLGSWEYIGRGRGDHGDGVYVLHVQPGFLGCLTAFESGKTHLRSGREAVQYDFGKTLTAEEKKALGWGGKSRQATDTFTTFDAGRPFYNTAAGLTPEQENLLAWIERNITLKKDTASKGNKAAQVAKTATDADEHRLYGPDFCPLLPPGRRYVGALGHFRRNAEIGFTLYGTESRTARHTAGIMSEMGYLLPPGAAHTKRAEMVTKALGDLKAVVVEYLDGIVAGYDGKTWVPLDQFPTLDEKTLCRKLRIFCFLPHDYETVRRSKWEEAVNRKATESLEEAEQDAWDFANDPEYLDEEAAEVDEPEEEEVILGNLVSTASPENGFRGWPLHRRLYAMLKEKGLKQKDLAAIFGVSPMSISYWIRGTEPDENGKVRGKPVPEELVPMVVRWLETGEGPTPEELAARKTRRAGVNPTTGKPRKPGAKRGQKKESGSKK